MSKLEKVAFTLAFGSVTPILLFLAGWWLSFTRVPENQVFIYALVGLVVGVLVDFTLLRKKLANPFNLSTTSLILTYIFYTICVFGFFMGVPLFNLFVGVLAGWYIGVKLRLESKSIDQSNKVVKKVALFSTLIMLIICLASASIALTDNFTAANLQGMLGLNFQITTRMIWGLIAIGGVGLVLLQYWLVKLVGYRSYKTIE